MQTPILDIVLKIWFPVVLLLAALGFFWRIQSRYNSERKLEIKNQEKRSSAVMNSIQETSAYQKQVIELLTEIRDSLMSRKK